jgi:hypothetical protein
MTNTSHGSSIVENRRLTNPALKALQNHALCDGIVQKLDISGLVSLYIYIPALPKMAETTHKNALRIFHSALNNKKMQNLT